jgi:CRISPR system Cascade subunit CasA
MDHPNLNMLTDPVFPVVKASGARHWIGFSGLLEEHGDFPAAFDWPRADLNVASAELAIGLLCLIYRPASHKEWEAIWDGGSDIKLAERISVLARHFNLFGDAKGKGPRFCQELEPLDGEANLADALFIDSPGINGQKKNTDLMTHRDRFPALGLKAAAMALYALQQFAPSGGAGNRTSLRGGGPMTTLVMPYTTAGAVPLRCQLLFNLPVLFESEWLEDEEMSRALPWLRPTITSEGAPPEEVAEASPAAHSAQALFGMPRRIRLVAEGSGPCPLTGEEGLRVTGFVQKPWGVKYSTWRHPLTPYRQNKEEAPYTVKPKPVRFGFRDWVGITVGRVEAADKAYPAEVVSALSLRMKALRKRGYREVQVLAAGWAMNNMEAESYLHSVQPLYLAPDDRNDLAEVITGTARRFAAAAEDAVRQLRGSLNEALFGGQAKSTNTSLFEESTDYFYESTEDAFHAALLSLKNDGKVSEDETRARAWLATLRRVALSIFDKQASSLLADTQDVKLAARITGAYATLAGRLSVTSKIAEALGIPQPVEKKKRTTSKASAGGGE